MGFCDEIQSPVAAVLFAKLAEKHGFIGFALPLGRGDSLADNAFVWPHASPLRLAITRYLRKG